MNAILLTLLLSQTPTIEGDKSIVVGDVAELTIANAGADVTSSVWLWQPKAPKTCKVNGTLSRLVGNRVPAKFTLTVVLAFKDGHQSTLQDELEFIAASEQQPTVAKAPAAILPFQALAPKPAEPPDLCSEPVAWASKVKSANLAAECRALSAGLSQLATACELGLVSAEATLNNVDYLDQVTKDVGTVFAVALGKDGFGAWATFADRLSSAFDDLEAAGCLESAEDYAAALGDVAGALAEVAEQSE